MLRLHCTINHRTKLNQPPRKMSSSDSAGSTPVRFRNSTALDCPPGPNPSEEEALVLYRETEVLQGHNPSIGILTDNHPSDREDLRGRASRSTKPHEICGIARSAVNLAPFLSTAPLRATSPGGRKKGEDATVLCVVHCPT